MTPSPNPLGVAGAAMPATDTTSKASKPAWQRFLPLAVIGGVLTLVVANGWHKQLTLENVFAVRETFQSFIGQHFILAMLAYIGAYAAAVAISVPGASILTLSGGLIFGWFFGGIAAVTGASIGAILLFLIARSAFGETLRAKAGPKINGLVDGFQKDALNYLLFLRLVPAFPFFVVNIAAALFNVPLRTYIIGTVIGIIPATFAFASIGAGLDSVFAKSKADQVACAAIKGLVACPLELSAKSLVTKEILIALTLLSVVALIPVAYKKWSQRNG
jgi:uncharacterized membrane protein YdjX (TVP38/TMEM64 family)